MPSIQQAADFQAPDQCLAGKVIAVTGAGDGIGKTAAITFAQHGATIILMGRTTAKLEQVYDEIERIKDAPQAAIYPINFEGAAEKDYEDMCNTLTQEFGRLDGLLHNAGVLGQRTPIQNYRTDIWMTVMQVNVNAPFMMTRALLPLLEQSQNGSILFTSSSVGRQGRAFWGAYSVSKGATENLVQVLADELTDTTGIRVNSINPGATRTAMRALAYPAENPAVVKAPADIMATYLFLMSDASIGISGCAFDAQPATQ